MEVINRDWECRSKWTGDLRPKSKRNQLIQEKERKRTGDQSGKVWFQRGTAQKSMNGNEEAEENSRYQNLEEVFVVAPLPCMNALSVYQRRGEENDKSRWMPLKLKRIKYLINSVIFKMFPWDVCCACRGEVQSEFGERRNSEWNARCQRKADQDVIKKTTSQQPKYPHMHKLRRRSWTRRTERG